METISCFSRQRLKKALLVGFQTCGKLLKFVIPLYLVVVLLKGIGVIDFLGRSCAPLMELFGLPGEAALAFIAGFLLNLYAAVAVLAPLNLDPFQVTQCGLMLGIAHNLVVEGGVLESTGARGLLLTLCRLLLAGVAGLLLQGGRALWG